jgi:hypothetical protein
MAVGVYAQVSFRGHGIPFWPAVLLSALGGGAGAVIEFVVIRRLTRGRSTRFSRRGGSS